MGLRTDELTCSLPKDREEMEQTVRTWIFGNAAPNKTRAKREPAVQSSATTQPQAVPTPATADSVASSVSNMSIASPRECAICVKTGWC